jgi:DNA-binding HxlR family transcriptional regulator
MSVMSRIDPATIACPVARAITAIGDRWSLLVIREAALGTSRFSDFRARLGVASDVLTDRLQALVERGVLERVAYQEEGSRTRTEYRLTDAGRELDVVLAALGDWGRGHLPTDADAGVRYRDHSGGTVQVAFVDADGRVLSRDQVEIQRA